MYKSVYWHRDVRAATAMVKKAILCLLESRAIASEDLYNLDDQGLFELLAAKESQAREEDRPYISAALQVQSGPLWHESAAYPYDEAPLDALEGPATGLRIIDIPEPISFETGLFLNKASVFTDEIAQSFVHKLRIVRIFSPSHP
jgi:hypothetical protein